MTARAPCWWLGEKLIPEWLPLGATGHAPSRLHGKYYDSTNRTSKTNRTLKDVMGGLHKARKRSYVRNAHMWRKLFGLPARRDRSRAPRGWGARAMTRKPPQKAKRVRGGLVIPVSLGGSGTGLTMYESVLECPRRWWLDEQLKAQGLPTSSANVATAMGTATHGLLQRYYETKKRFNITNVVYKDVAGGHEWSLPVKSAAIAQKLFRHYAVKFPVNEFTVVAVEERLIIEAAPWKPKGLPLTMQLDLVIKVTAAQVKRALVRRRVPLTPGYYVVDHKCHMRENPTLNDRHTLSLQQEGYGLGWMLKYPRRRLQGRLINMLVDAPTVPKFRTLLLPPPDGAAERRVANMLTQAGLLMKASEPPPAFHTACVSKWGDICSHYLEGRCSRY